MPSDLELLARLLLAALFDVRQVTELARREGVAVRGLDLEEGKGGGRVVLVARLPPRYRPERLLEELTRLRGVREVEWER